MINLWNKIKSIFSKKKQKKKSAIPQTTFTDYIKEGNDLIRKSVIDGKIGDIIARVAPDLWDTSVYQYIVQQYNNGTVCFRISSTLLQKYSFEECRGKLDQYLLKYHNAKFLSKKETDIMMLLI